MTKSSKVWLKAQQIEPIAWETKQITRNDYFQLRMLREWKDRVRMVSEVYKVSLSEFIRMKDIRYG